MSARIDKSEEATKIPNCSCKKFLPEKAGKVAIGSRSLEAIEITANLINLISLSLLAVQPVTAFVLHRFRHLTLFRCRPPYVTA